MDWKKTLSDIFKQQINKFPGCLPVSIDYSNVELLSYGYSCSLKSDGDRVFVFIEGDNLLILTRSEQVHGIATFSSPYSLFDAEILGNNIYLFDTLVYKGHNTTKECYVKRIELARLFVHSASSSHASSSFSKAAFPSKYPDSYMKISNKKIIVKQIYPAHLCKQIWNNRQKDMYDGLIFMKLLTPYTLFRSSISSVLKWKPSELITIDFLVKRRDKEEDILDHVNGVHEKFKVAKGNVGLYVVTITGRLLLVSFAYADEEGIWEFSWNKTGWYPEKHRSDKKNPNTIETVVKTIRSIEDCITIENMDKQIN